MTAARTGALRGREGTPVARCDVSMPRTTAAARRRLMWAAAEGHAAVVQSLIEAGADVRTRLPSGFTPLLFAARDGRTEVVRALLKAGADVNETIPATDSGSRYGGRMPPVGSDAAAAGGHERATSSWRRSCWTPAPIRTPIATGYTVPPYSLRRSATRVSATTIRSRRLGQHDQSRAVEEARRARRQRQRADDEEGEPEQHAAERDRRDAVPAGCALTADARADEDCWRQLGADPALTNADNSTPLMVAAGLATRSPGEDAGTRERSAGSRAGCCSISAPTSMRSTTTARPRCTAARVKNLPKVVKLPRHKRRQDRRLESNDKFGWTPLAYRGRLYRFGNFKPSAETEAAIS